MLLMLAEPTNKSKSKKESNNQRIKNIVICADDFGQTPAVSEGIIQLLVAGKINATSCLVNSNYWEDSAAKLKNIYKESMQIGLHLNLTEGKPLTNVTCLQRGELFIGLSPLLIKAFTYRLNKDQIYQELKAQLEQFMTVWGQKPNFLDGHQHIHHLPIVRDVVLDLYREFDLAENKTYVRSVANMVGVTGLKPKIIVATGAKKLERLLDKHAVPHNTTFSGAYNFAENRDFAKVFGEALENITDGGLIMCHPGVSSREYSDVLAKSRPKELAYFLSDEFTQKMSQCGIILLYNMRLSRDKS